MNNIEQSRTRFFPNSKEHKINNSNPLQNVLKRNDIAKSNEIKNKTNGNANVAISEAVKDFARIKNAVDNAPEIDNSAKIAKLKAEINSGEYEIDYDGLADKILNSEF